MLESFGRGPALLCSALSPLPKKMWVYQPSSGRWSIHEIILHLADREVNSYFSFRRLIAEPHHELADFDAAQWAGSLGYFHQSTREALEIIRRLWEGETVTFHGKQFNIEGARLAPLPAPELSELIGKRITGKKIAIGVIDHHTLQVETPDDVAALIRRALEHIPADRLVIASDCGMGREGMSRRHAFFKMVALVEGTNIVRRELGAKEAPCLAADERFSLLERREAR